MSQQAGVGATRRLGDLIARPLRMYAPFSAAGAVLFAVASVWLLAHSGAGVVVFAEGRPGTAITMPATAAGESVVVYAVTKPGQPVPDTECDLATSTDAFANQTYTGLSVTWKGRSLRPVWGVAPGWRAGDSLTCTGTGFEGVVLGKNAGLTSLLQGLLAAFVAVGAGIMGLIGFAIRRRMV